MDMTISGELDDLAYGEDDKQVEISQECYKPIMYYPPSADGLDLNRDPYTLAMPRADDVK